jgi:hypothetical protein
MIMEPKLRPLPAWATDARLARIADDLVLQCALYQAGITEAGINLADEVSAELARIAEGE